MLYILLKNCIFVWLLARLILFFFCWSKYTTTLYLTHKHTLTNLSYTHVHSNMFKPSYLNFFQLTMLVACSASYYYLSDRYTHTSKVPSLSLSISISLSLSLSLLICFLFSLFTILLLFPVSSYCSLFTIFFPSFIFLSLSLFVPLSQFFFLCPIYPVGDGQIIALVDLNVHPTL